MSAIPQIAKGNPELTMVLAIETLGKGINEILVDMVLVRTLKS